MLSLSLRVPAEAFASEERVTETRANKLHPNIQLVLQHEDDLRNLRKATRTCTECVVLCRRAAVTAIQHHKGFIHLRSGPSVRHALLLRRRRRQCACRLRAPAAALWRRLRCCLDIAQRLNTSQLQPRVAGLALELVHATSAPDGSRSKCNAPAGTCGMLDVRHPPRSL